jgi:hypothetical protein
MLATTVNSDVRCIVDKKISGKCRLTCDIYEHHQQLYRTMTPTNGFAPKIKHLLVDHLQIPISPIHSLRLRNLGVFDLLYETTELAPTSTLGLNS